MLRALQRKGFSLNDGETLTAIVARRFLVRDPGRLLPSGAEGHVELNSSTNALAKSAADFVEIAEPFFERYKALIPTSLRNYFDNLRRAAADWHKHTRTN